MNKQYFLIIVALVFIAVSCGQNKVENPYKTEKEQVEKNKEIAMNCFYEAWNNGNFAVVDELIAPDALDHSMIPGKPAVQGPASFKQIVGMFRASIPDIKLTILDDFGSGDKICHRWVLAGHHTAEPLMGVPASGREISFGGTTIVRFEDGKIMERWSNVDIFGVAVQLGLVPASDDPPPADK